MFLAPALQAQPANPPAAAASAAIAPAADAASAPAPAPAEVRFDILEFIVAGDTVLGSAAIERTVYPFLGPQRSAADAEGARRALEAAYHAAGYLSVSVLLPSQRVDGSNSAVRLQVVQGAVDKLRITGAQRTLPSQVRQAVPSLQPGNVPNFPEMQQELGDLARASADREITPVIAAGSQPGTMDVELKVQDRLPVHGWLELNNKQSENTEAGRLEAGLSYDNLFQRGHSIGLSWFYSPLRPDEANIQTLTYHLPLGGQGDRLFLSVQHSDSNTPTALGGATISRGDTWRARWRDQLPARPGIDQALTWGYTWRQLRDRNRDVAGVDVVTPELRYPSFSLGYEASFSPVSPGAKRDRSTRLQAELRLGTEGLGRREVDCYGTAKDQFDCKRAGAQAQFQVYTASLDHREPLGAQGAWALDVRLQGQYADGPLVPAEQASYGGSDSARGYYEGQYSGDRGAALRVELMAPAWRLGNGALLLQPLGWLDQAWLETLSTLPGEESSALLGSTGLGLRVQSGLGLQAALYWSQLLRHDGRPHRWDLSLRLPF